MHVVTIDNRVAPAHASDWDRRWFSNHRAFADRFYERREALAANLKVPLAGPLGKHDLTFIDEFHYDEGGIASLTGDVAAALDPLISA